MKNKHQIWSMLVACALVIGLGGVACQKKGPVASDDSGGNNVSLTSIHFDFDKYNIRSDAESTLESHSQWLKNNSGVNIVVEGHTDEWGTEEYNLALGERRANAAKSFLVNLGVSPDRLSTISYGESRPIDSAHNSSAWSQNRRDEFKGRN